MQVKVNVLKSNQLANIGLKKDFVLLVLTDGQLMLMVSAHKKSSIRSHLAYDLFDSMNLLTYFTFFKLAKLII